LIRTLLRDERGQVEFFDALIALLILGGVVGALGLGVVVALVASILIMTPMALFIFIWRKIFPIARSIAEWTTNRVNFFPFVTFMLIIISATGIPLIIWIVLFFYTGYWVFFALSLPLIPILGLALLINGVALGLAIIKWTIDLNHYMFDRFRTRFLTFAFGMVMRIARRHQLAAESPKPGANKRRWRRKRPQNKAANPQKKAENPHSSANKRRWRPKRRQ